MSATGTITVSGTITGLPEGQKTLSETMYLNNAVGETLDLTLASGNNVIQIPTGATYVLIVPPAANAIDLKLGNNTGFAISRTNPGLYPLDPNATSFTIYTAGPTTGVTSLSFA